MACPTAFVSPFGACDVSPRVASGVRSPRGLWCPAAAGGLLFGAWDLSSAREPADRSVGGVAHVWNRGFACGIEGLRAEQREGAQMARESAVSA